MSQVPYDNFPGASLNGGGEQKDLLYLLIQGIGKHAVEEDADELARFQQRIDVETNRLKEAVGSEQMKPAVESVVQLMASHNEAVKADHIAHDAELNGALRMMIETIGYVGKSSQAAVHQLGIIEKNLEELSTGADAKTLRTKLGVCLKMIREQSESLHAQSTQHLSQLKAFVASSSVAHQAGLLEEPLDTVTGLPGRAFAENLIQEKFACKTDCLVGVVRIDRLASFHSKHGQAAVDDIIKTATRLLAQRLPVGSTLCRWSGNSFIAITEITSSYAETAQQWRKVGGLKLEKNIEEGTRIAFVMLTTTMLVEHLRVMASRRGLIQNIDRFVFPQSGELAA